MFLFFKKLSSWNDIFPGTLPVIKKNIMSRVAVADDHLHIIDSEFIEVKETTKGGAVFCQTNTYKRLLIEKTVFTSCTSDEKGGGIWFVNDGEIVLTHICAYNCHSTQKGQQTVAEGGQFDYIQLNPGLGKKSMFTLSCIYSPPNCVYYGGTILHKEGMITLSQTNQSCTHCQADTVFFGYPTINENGPSAFFSFSSFSNNTASDSRIFTIARFGGGGTFNIDHCNIIHNSQVETHDAIFSTHDKIIFQTCSILNNGDRNFFDGYGKGTAIFNDCSTDFDATKKIYGEYTIFCVAQTSFVNPVIGINTQKCLASYDSVGEITPENLPKRTVKCFTKGNNSQSAESLIALIFNPVFLIPIGANN